MVCENNNETTARLAVLMHCFSHGNRGTDFTLKFSIWTEHDVHFIFPFIILNLLRLSSLSDIYDWVTLFSFFHYKRGFSTPILHHSIHPFRLLYWDIFVSSLLFLFFTCFCHCIYLGVGISHSRSVNHTTMSNSSSFSFS